MSSGMAVRNSTEELGILRQGFDPISKQNIRYLIQNMVQPDEEEALGAYRAR